MSNLVMNDRLSAYRIDVSSLPVFTRKLFLVDPRIQFVVRNSAHEGKVVIYHEDSAVRAVLRRVLLSL